MPNSLRTSSKYFAWISLLLAAIAAVLLLLGYRSPVQPFVVGALSFFALFCMRHPALKSYAFTVWVFAFVAASMFYPWVFLKWGSYDLKNLIVPLIQIIMFGMGTTLSVADFARVLKMPWPVFIGFTSHYIIMPLTGFTLAKTFGFPPEIAAGVVLIGCCPSGVASNVMAYLGGGNVALSVTVTSCSTLAAPLMTPFLMKYLAGQFVKVEFLSMMLDIVNMIIVPIVAGLIANRILYSRRRLCNRPIPLGCLAAAGIGATVLLVRYSAGFLDGVAYRLDLLLSQRHLDLNWVLPVLRSLTNGVIFGLVLIVTVILAKLVVSVWLGRSDKWMDKVLPLVSMVSICCIIAVITARSANDLKAVGALLIVAVMIHNAVGYCVGYWLARAVRLEESACRTVAFEVGMQNGGMASALAINTLKSVPAALAPAIFGPWMNISGSVLATYWHRKPAVQGVPAKSGEGVPPLRDTGILPAMRGQDALVAEDKAKMASPQGPDGVTPSE